MEEKELELLSSMPHLFSVSNQYSLSFYYDLRGD